jgi:hypothetical protein
VSAAAPRPLPLGEPPDHERVGRIPREDRARYGAGCLTGGSVADRSNGGGWPGACHRAKGDGPPAAKGREEDDS